MRAVLQLLLLAPFASLVGAADLYAQKTFEGTISYEVDMGGSLMRLAISARGRRVRQEMDMPGSNIVSKGTYQLIEYDKHSVITVVPVMKRYMVLDFAMTRRPPDAARDSARDKALAGISATGRKETVAGVECEVYVVKDRPGDEWCITSALGHFLGLEEGSRATPFGGGPPTGAFMRNFKGGAVLLRMRMTGSDGHDITVVATKVDRATPPASNFSIPAGFEEMQNPTVPRQ